MINVKEEIRTCGWSLLILDAAYVAVSLMAIGVCFYAGFSA